jgi:hypothetical protein
LLDGCARGKRDRVPAGMRSEIAEPSMRLNRRGKSTFANEQRALEPASHRSDEGR